MQIQHARNLAATTYLQIAGAIVPAVVTISIGRTYGVEDFGRYCVAVSAIGVISILFNAGIANALCYEIARADPTDKQRLRSIVVTGILILVVGSLCAVPVAVSAVYVLRYDATTRMLISLLATGYWLIALTTVLGSVARGLKLMHLPVIPNFAVLACICILVLPALAAQRPLWQIAAIWSLSQLAGFLSMAWIIFRVIQLGPFEVSFREFKHLARRCIAIGLDSVIFRLGAQMTSILLPIFLVFSQVGIFSSASRLFLLLFVAPNAVIEFFSPYIASANSRNADRVPARIDKLHKYAFFISTSLFIPALVYPEALINAVFGSQYLESTACVRIIALGSLLYFCPPYPAVLKVLGHEWSALRSSVVQAITNLICLVILVPLWGTVGAAVSVSLSYVSHWIVSWLLYRNLGLPTVRRWQAFPCLLAFSIGISVMMRFAFGGSLGVMILSVAMGGGASLLYYWQRDETAELFAIMRQSLAIRGVSRCRS